MVLMYHNIGSEPGFYTVALRAFERQMKFLKDHYNVVSVADYLAAIKKRGSNDSNHVAITFDDAYTSYAELALPVMEALALPSALFACTDFLGRSNEWDVPANRFPIMDAERLKRLSQASLATIGAHSASHRSLAKVAAAELNEELSRPKIELQRIIGKEVNYLAYPFGQPHIDFNAKVIEAVKLAGYDAAFATDYAISNRQKDCFALHRVEVSPADDFESFKSRFKSFQPRYFKQKIKNFIYALKGS